MSWVLKLFGASNFTVSKVSIVRINTLRERRNAVAHGGESSSVVGERYTMEELHNIYSVADELITDFLLNLREYCVCKHYLKNHT